MSRKQFAAIWSTLFFSPIAGFAFVVGILSLGQAEIPPVRTVRPAAAAAVSPTAPVKDRPVSRPQETAVQTAVRKYIADYYGENPDITKWQEFSKTTEQWLFRSRTTWEHNEIQIPAGTTILRTWYVVSGEPRDRVYFLDKDAGVYLVMEYEEYRWRAYASGHSFRLSSMYRGAHDERLRKLYEQGLTEQALVQQELPFFPEPGDAGAP